MTTLSITFPDDTLNKLPECWFRLCSALHLDWGPGISQIEICPKPRQSLRSKHLHHFLPMGSLVEDIIKQLSLSI